MLWPYKDPGQPRLASRETEAQLHPVPLATRVRIPARDLGICPRPQGRLQVLAVGGDKGGRDALGPRPCFPAAGRNHQNGDLLVPLSSRALGHHSQGTPAHCPAEKSSIEKEGLGHGHLLCGPHVVTLSWSCLCGPGPCSWPPAWSGWGPDLLPARRFDTLR